MTEFKIGDRVRRISQDTWGPGWVLNVGDTGTVVGVNLWHAGGWHAGGCLSLGHITDGQGVYKPGTLSGPHDAAFFELVAQEVSSDQSLSNGDTL